MASLPIPTPVAASSEIHDPVWEALRNAPLSDEPLSHDELLIVADAIEKVPLGQRGVGPDRVRAIIEAMRHDSYK
jgi:hypothetical protein